MSSQSSYSETITTAAKAECHNSQVNMIGLLDATHKAHTCLVHMPPCFNTSAFEVLSASLLFLQTELPCPPKKRAQRQLVNLHIRSCCHNHSRNPHQNPSIPVESVQSVTALFQSSPGMVPRPWRNHQCCLWHSHDCGAEDSGPLVHLGSSWFTQL